MRGTLLNWLLTLGHTRQDIAAEVKFKTDRLLRGTSKTPVAQYVQIPMYVFTAVAQQEWITKQSKRAFNIWMYLIVHTSSISHLIEDIQTSQPPYFCICNINWIVPNISSVFCPLCHPVSSLFPFTFMSLGFSSASSAVSSWSFFLWEQDPSLRSSSCESSTSHTVFLSHWFPSYSRTYLYDGSPWSESES